jgi:hypothetical protein
MDICCPDGEKTEKPPCFLFIVMSISCSTGQFNVELGWCVFQLYRGRQFHWWRKSKNPGKATDLQQDTDKLYHIMLHTSP